MPGYVSKVLYYYMLFKNFFESLVSKTCCQTNINQIARLRFTSHSKSAAACLYQLLMISIILQ